MEQKESRLVDYAKKAVVVLGIVGMAYAFTGCESLRRNMDSSGSITLFRIEKNFGSRGVQRSGVFYDIHRKSQRNYYGY